MEKDDQMNLILGIGPEIKLSTTVAKTIRVGTVKQLKDVGELYKADLKRPKFQIHENNEEQINKWIEILNIIFIDGFTQEEFEDSIPELMENAVERFLFT